MLHGWDEGRGGNPKQSHDIRNPYLPACIPPFEASDVENS